MSELTISSTRWLAISLRNSSAFVFHLNDAEQWQCLQAVEAKKPTSDTQPKQDDDDDSTTDLTRNLVRFAPNGQRLAVNGPNKQIYIYVLSIDAATKTFWKLEKTIAVKKRASAIDLTDEFLLIADKTGDVYRVDLTTQDPDQQDDCLMGHLSMLLDVLFLRPFIVTADRDEKIRLSRYPNAYNIEGFCLGHTEFVSHVKPIDSTSILSASGDGTLRQWKIPECVETNRWESRSFISSSKRIRFPPGEINEENLELSSLDASIWKLDVRQKHVALSIYASRNHSLFVTNFSNSVQFTFDSQFGNILDYAFASESNLYVLFDTHRLVRLDVEALTLAENDDETLTKINAILQEKEFPPVNDSMFHQLFKSRGQPGDSSYYKRKNERIEQEEAKRAKKQAMRQVQSPDQ